VEADVLLVGHTHLPFIRHPSAGRRCQDSQRCNRRPGGPEASHAVWEDGRFSLRKATYPVELTVEKMGQLGLPPEIAEALRQLLETGSP
jgi:protein phosphatase